MEKFTFFLESQFNNVEMVRIKIRAVLTKRFSKEALPAINDFCQIVTELLNNSVEHGNCSFIEGELVINDSQVSFTLFSKGVRFDPTTTGATMPELDPDNDLPEGGYGLAIIKQLSDAFTYSYSDGKNITTVSKQLTGKDT